MRRRELVKNLVLASGGAALEASWRFRKVTSGRPTLPDLPSPGNSRIDHVVVVTMENRSFDHFLGWLPNADGKQAGLTYLDTQGIAHSTYSLSGDNTGCPHPDPDHSYDGARTEYDSGKMDGFLRASTNDIYSIGYYGEKDIPFYAALAEAVHFAAVVFGARAVVGMVGI